MHSSLSPQLTRRALLGVGAAGLAAAVTGCSIRLDRDPQLPAFTRADEVRNTVAQILAATTADGADAAVLNELSTAVGPVWTPPAELATAPPPTEPPREFREALSEIVTEVTQNFTDLTGPVTGTLLDVATGALLVLGTPSELDDARTKLAEPDPAPPAPANASPGAAGADGGAASQETAEHPLAAYTLACYQGSYGYERLAVHTDKDSDFGIAARARVESLALTAEEIAVFLPQLLGQQAPTDQAAWQLQIDPVDESSAHELAVLLEDSLAAALADVFRTAMDPSADWYPDPQAFGQARAFAASGLYATAVARARAGRQQTLRFTAAEPTQEAS